ncbi:hypothetical protein BDA96_02G161900 [Sorghum bicolor]|uniref:peptidylprolyl isomerase n=2 Tax=Sorghum bicolor TaxID=4558 RepID=A0A921RQA8_SORBI|nr:peptidyl-prolyl cis-trans isomerase FKBP53 [Sorghum bicolor]KAG0543112.1 hypothetical protein BDA96_02G161900 [Sorghum bicolor]KXG35300.1 hypothetical protein SORBI_3002G155200 [Sorghum bicolor]|eukprot:XP_021308543.1 peptidyl-prolyl cis-trans isomerase FKBP53 [Sorghum bicolor]
MAFWGVEVKPGKPYTHTHQADHGRLRICQATLGNCDAAARTVLQCNVGNKIPIKLCSLNPKLAETCHLEIEFEEVDDVVFSVIGQSSIHLSGYYVRASSRSNVGDDESESYGEDIGHSDTDEEHDASEDSYESDFIDDREVPTPEKYGSDSIDDSDYECTLRRRRKQKAVEKPTQKAERRRRLKKHQVDSTDDNYDDTPVTKPVVKRSAKIFDSGDDDTPVTKPVDKRSAPSMFDSSSDEDDNVPISLALGKKDNAKVAEETDPQNGQANDITKKKIVDVKKRKHSAISEDPALSMDTTDVNATSVSKQGDEIKKKSKKKMKNQSGEKDEKQSNIRTLEDGLMVEDLSIGNIDAKVASDGCKVYIKYVGMLKNGKIVQSNASEKPYKFKLGAGKVIRGWDVGIRGMRVGEKRKVTVPPSMLSGGKSVGEVPDNSSVIYEIELVKVK